MPHRGTPLPRRDFLGLAAAGSVAASLSACGGEDDAGPTVTRAAASPPASAAPTPSPEPGGTLNVLYIEPHAGASEQLAAEFQQLTGATVNATIIPYDQVEQQATEDVQSGTGAYDVFEVWYVTVGALAADGIIERLDGLAVTPEVDSRDFIPSIYDPYSLYDRGRYALPFDGDAHVLFHNTQILERNGLQPPQTWDEYAEAVRRITEAEGADGVYGAALMAQSAPIIIVSTYANRLAGFGGGTFLDDAGRPTINTESAVSAAQSLLDVAPFALPTPTEVAFDQALPAFLSGQVAFVEFWTDLGVSAEDPEQSRIAGNWGVTRLPIGGRATASRAALNAGFGMAVSTASANKDLARQFVTYATSRETNLSLITTTGSGIDPTRLSTVRDPSYASFAPQVQEAATAALDGALAWPTNQQAPQLLQSLADALSAMLLDGGDPQQTMDEVQGQWEDILG
ncbi:MAG: ABC transporter substrate-binding protein [Kineosporiaceae bacterium]